MIKYDILDTQYQEPPNRPLDSQGVYNMYSLCDFKSPYGMIQVGIDMTDTSISKALRSHLPILVKSSYASICSCPIVISARGKTLQSEKKIQQKTYSSWWFQPISKILVNLDCFPK